MSLADVRLFVENREKWIDEFELARIAVDEAFLTQLHLKSEERAQFPMTEANAFWEQHWTNTYPTIDSMEFEDKFDYQPYEDTPEFLMFKGFWEEFVAENKAKVAAKEVIDKEKRRVAQKKSYARKQEEKKQKV